MTRDSLAIGKKGQGTLIDISVTPNAGITEISGYDSWRKRIIVRIKERPLENRANLEVISLFSKILGVEVKIVRGAKSSKKTLEALIKPGEARRILHDTKRK